MVCIAPRKWPPWPTSRWASNARSSSVISSGVNSFCSSSSTWTSITYFSKHETRPPSSQPAVCITKLVPARKVGSIVISDSQAAWASGTCEELSPPPARNGSPKCRAIWPVHSSPTADSGVPNCGDPDCMSMFDRNEPKTTGAPGRISWLSAMPVSASAICCASADGIVTGDIAPMSRNGVSTTGWLAAEYSNCASSMRSSQRSGELQLISEMQAGVCSIASRPPKQDLAHRDGVARVLAGHHVAHVDLVGERHGRVEHVEVPGVERRVVRLGDDAADAVHHGEALRQLGEVAVVLERRLAAHVAVAHEGRAVDAGEDHVVAADVHVVGVVAGLDVELPRRLGHLREDPLGVELDVVAVDLLPRGAEQLDRLRLHELDADLATRSGASRGRAWPSSPRRGSRSAASG